MANLHLDKPWRTLVDALPNIRGQLGVFQLANAKFEIIFIGCAGAREPFGLKSAVETASARCNTAVHLRYEITSSYVTRYRELLMLYQAKHGNLPQDNPTERLGRLSPSS